MQAIQILPYFLSVFSYLLPICCFLPFKLKFRQKVILFVILLINMLLIGFVVGNIGVILLIISTCIFIALLNPNRLMNICVFKIGRASCRERAWSESVATSETRSI